MKTAIFYGSNGGNTRRTAEKIAEALGAGTEVFNVRETAPSKVADYDMLVLGTSTWGKGQLQKDWLDFIAALRELDLKGKTIAVFGNGDTSMADTFCDGVGQLYNELQYTGARFTGAYPTDGYKFRHSLAVPKDDGLAVGLLIDDVQHPLLTPDRIKGWAEQLRKA